MMHHDEAMAGLVHSHWHYYDGNGMILVRIIVLFITLLMQWLPSN
jgi:hypothetical protein